MKFSWQEGNKLELLINGEQYFPRVFECIRNARKEILLETFIIFADQVGLELKQALLEAAQRGVCIQITVDGYGTAGLDSSYIAELTEAGINIRMFDPSPRMLGMRTNLFRRLHRKIVVVDGEVAFIGGINFGADHLLEYGPESKQDYAIEARGPIVNDIRRISQDILITCAKVREFPHIEDYQQHEGKSLALVAVRDNAKHHRDIETHYLHALRQAQHRVVLANAYFLPSYRLLRELRKTAQRGVNVSLILQGRPDMPWARACTSLIYNYLVQHGVTIYEYCQRPLHAKVAVVDDEWCTVGSSNLDPLSLSLNLEANLIIRDADLNRQLHEDLSSLATNHCEKITARIAVRGRWWRAPLASLCFHFLRHFPAMAGMLPAHTPKLEIVTTEILDEVVEAVAEEENIDMMKDRSAAEK